MEAKKRKLVRFVSFLLFLMLVFSVIPVSAETVDELIERAGQFVIYNIENEQILMSKNKDTLIFPGSTVKIMSGLIICEVLKDRTDETVTVTDEMLRGVQGKNMGLSVGQRLTVKELMYAAFSCGCNDAVTVLAHLSFGNIPEFIDEMNRRAMALSMNSTYYSNVTGLDSTSQKTTISDTLKVVVEAAKNRLYLEVSSEYNYKVRFADGTTRLVYGSNELMNKNSVYLCRSAKGMNSGSTEESGYCVVTYGEKNDASYVVVVMGCQDSDDRFALAQEALQYAYDNMGYETLVPTGAKVGSTTVSNAWESGEVDLVLNEDLQVFKSISEDMGEFQYCLILNDNPKAPIEKGQTVGRYIALRGGNIYGSADVTVKDTVEQNGFLSFMDSIKGYVTGRAFTATVICMLASVLLAVVLPMVTIAIRQKRTKYVRHRGGFKLKK